MMPTEDAYPTPTLDLEWVAGCFEKLKTCTIELDPDPLEYGPGRLVEKIHILRTLQNEVERMNVQASREFGDSQRSRIRLEAMYNIQKDTLLASDLSIRAGRSQSDRVAMVNLRLKPLLEAIDAFKMAEADVKTLIDVIRSVKSSLSSTDRQIKAQMGLIRQEIDLGSEWRAQHEKKAQPKDESTLSAGDFSFGDVEMLFPAESTDDEDFAEALDGELARLTSA